MLVKARRLKGGSSQRWAAIVLAAAVVFACGARLGTGGASPTNASPRTNSLPSLSSPSTLPSPTQVVPLLGACTTANSAARVVLEHLFELTTSGDARKVADCYARSYLDTRPTFGAVANEWANAGPATVASIRLLDRVNECDRFEVIAELAHGDTVGWQGPQRVFYSVGLDSGVPRVFDAGSALAAPDVTRVTCR
jgi:hypothetical protein